ncbi:hypothetical protein AAG570_006671 [Ranatra chinensis]|uniref:Uncharacterized protein n=1 Tax=Ranatra chinensis TaxID=642074 RepID=A0ABD0ZBP7_9HEMI
MASKRRNMSHKNKKQETTCIFSPFCDKLGNCDYPQTLKAENGVQAPKYVLPEREVRDDRNRQKISSKRRNMFHKNTQETTKNGHLLLLVRPPGPLLTHPDGRCALLSPCPTRIYPRVTLDYELAQNREVEIGTPQGLLWEGLKSSTLGDNAEVMLPSFIRLIKKKLQNLPCPPITFDTIPIPPASCVRFVGLYIDMARLNRIDLNRKFGPQIQTLNRQQTQLTT